MKRHLITPPRRPADRRWAPNPLWYKDAIIYEVRVRSFYDSNGDGIGDFRGLATKLDYLQDLGVTRALAAAVLPLAAARRRLRHRRLHRRPSRRRARSRTSSCFLNEAHRRGLRVITELVLNHTSDQHPWFQRARRAPPGSVERDFYVWSDTPIATARRASSSRTSSRRTGRGIRSRKAYFWHRFYAHQPDLNFENPAVHEALLGVGRLLVRHGRRRAAPRRGAVPLRGRGDELREPARRRTPS